MDIRSFDLHAEMKKLEKIVDSDDEPPKKCAKIREWIRRFRQDYSLEE